MSEPKLTLGKAIDQIIEALGSFDDKDRKAILGTVCSHLQIDLGARPIPYFKSFMLCRGRTHQRISAFAC